MIGIETLGSALAARFDGERHGATALEYRGQSISYSDLAAASQSIANELGHSGVKKGAHVGVLAEDGSLIVPAMIGILARDCVFALLDPAHPPNHLRELVDTADLACLFVEDTLFSVAEEALWDNSCCIRSMNACIYSPSEQSCSISALLAQTTERALYLYFTSGTSGRPRPILGRADSLMQFIKWEIATLGLGANVRVSQLTSPSHDPYLRDVFVPLVAGGTVCIPDCREVVLSPIELGQWLNLAQIQLIHCTPTIFRNLCSGGLVGRTFDRLTHVLIAGEQLRGAHLAAWYRAFGDRVQLVNLYGPTETTLAKLFYFVSSKDVRRAAVPIGQPIDGARVRIMATPSQECKVGEIGELHIETTFGTLGYYKQPILTRDVFEPDPSESIDRPVVYKTGDFVKRLPDGNIEFVGRTDRQQKVRGKQVDLGRIEDEIINRTEIESCTVFVATSDEDGTPDRLIAYYVADREYQGQFLKQLLSQEMPKQMIPDVWIRVDLLPTNVNGKVNGSELVALLAKHDSLQGHQAARDAEVEVSTESRLLELWKELLRNDVIGFEDPFMEVGGDSLSIMLLIARLEQDYGYNLSIWQVFDNLTIRRLSALIDGDATLF